MSKLSRRRSLAALSAAAVTLTAPRIARGAVGRVAVVGGGFGGATAARYLKAADPALEVTLIEPAERFYTCPFTNLHLGGLVEFESLGHGYGDLVALGVRHVRAMAAAVDPAARTVRLADGATVAYDRLVLSPGIDIRWGALAGYDEAAAERAPHAWKAGPQTHVLKRQLEAMPDGGTVVMVCPGNPFRCPPGPYERAAMIAHYLKTTKPRSKVLLLDAKDQFSKQGLFVDGWKAAYGPMIEWVGLANDGKVVRVDAVSLEVETEFGRKVKADVLNVIPPQMAGAIAKAAGVTNESGWVPVKPDTFESTLVPGVHVVGDATIAAPMPKSGFCANAQGKVAAAAIAASLAGRDPPPAVWTNTCYSLIAPDYGISVAGVYRVKDGKIVEVEGAGGVSPRQAEPAFRRKEAEYGRGWYAAIAADTWGTGRA
jgi:NADPH-dependent 2,4-dienoyl-CoA reductase/sulfur reductase-like enzyme